MFALAKELGFYKEYSIAINEISRCFNEKKGKPITLNAVGAIGAILADMGFDHSVMRSFAVAAQSRRSGCTYSGRGRGWKKRKYRAKVV